MSEQTKYSSWRCVCGADNQVEFATTRRHVICAYCGRDYAVPTLHVDGSPMLIQLNLSHCPRCSKRTEAPGFCGRCKLEKEALR